MTAPLNGAVVGNAVVKVEGNRKSVQHLDGGIVKELRVKEGDKVKAGDVLRRARRDPGAGRIRRAVAAIRGASRDRGAAADRARSRRTN